MNRTRDLSQTRVIANWMRREHYTPKPIPRFDLLTLRMLFDYLKELTVVWLTADYCRLLPMEKDLLSPL